MATKKVAAKKTTTALVPWTEKFAKYAKEGTEQVANVGAGGGLGISFKPGAIYLGDEKLKTNSIECVILGSCALNRFNKDAYDADNPQPPDCYAFALVSDDPDTKPHPAATSKQANLCIECDNFAFGSAANGKGKACASTIRLAIFLAKDVEDASGIGTAEIATAGVSVTNRPHFKKYLDAVAEDEGRPTWAVVTQITSHQDDKTQIRLEFKLVELIEDDAVLLALEKRFNKVQELLQRPFSAPTEKKAPVGKAQKFAAKAAKKVATKR